MKRLERLTAILSLLQAKRFTSLATIRDRFSISERTVFRDLRSLEEAGVPIGFEKDKGYFILDRHFLGPLAFTIEEAKSFIFVEQLARKYTDETTFQHFSSALEKIKNKLKDQQLDDLEELQSRISAYINPKYENQYLHFAERACKKRQVLKITYIDAKGDKTIRQIEPIGLTFYSQNWHLIAYCQLREDYRDFSLARIQNLTISNQIFQRNHLSLKEYIEQLT